MELGCAECGQQIVKTRLQPSFYEEKPYHWRCIAPYFLDKAEGTGVELGKLIIVAEVHWLGIRSFQRRDSVWRCLLCQRDIGDLDYGVSGGSMKAHLYSDHYPELRGGALQVGYTWIGYQQGSWGI